MNDSDINKIEYYQFESFQDKRIKHGIFMRHGGCSPYPWDSLNLSTTGGDSLANVAENRRRVLLALNLNPEKFFDVWQVHSSTVVIAEKNREMNQGYIKADAIITSKPGISLLMRFADCVPILLFDPIQAVIAIVHAGWIGTLDWIAQKTIKEMGCVFGSQPENIIAGIGPSICVNHYPVGDDVIKKLKAVFPENWNDFIKIKSKKKHLDLWKLNSYVLEKSGVKKIELSGVCTVCDKGNWFSHRGENGRTGRFAGVITLINL